MIPLLFVKLLLHHQYYYLKKKGYVVDSGGHRGLRLSQEYLNKKSQKEGIPVVGRVAAGEPILAEENIEGYVDLKELFRHQCTYILAAYNIGQTSWLRKLEDYDWNFTFHAHRDSRHIHHAKLVCDNFMIAK